MQIIYLGHSSFLIKTNQAKIVCDPYPSNHPDLGLKCPKGITADIVTISHDHYDHTAISNVGGDPYVVREPGEFEIKGVNIYGVQVFHDEAKGAERGENNIYLIESEGLSVCHLGDLGHALDSEQANELSEVDILMVPVGGKYTLDAKKAAEVVSKVEPKVVIPMHYKVKDLTLDIEGVDPFLKEMGAEGVEVQESFESKSRDTLPEEMQVVVLEKRK